MLLNVHVKNLALIEDVDVYFKEGLNILTGETGAGKSIIIGSINIALGAKSAKDMIRNGAEYGLVELVFQVEDAEVISSLKSMDIIIEDDNQVVITRKLMNGRSITKINGETASVALVKEVTSQLIDIHGQHDHQSLLYKVKHLEILDKYAGNELLLKKKTFKEEYKKYKNLKQKLSQFDMDEEQRNREIAFYQFEIDEIDEAGLVAGEDEELENTFKRMNNSKSIAETMYSVIGRIGKENDESAGSQISMAVKSLNQISSFDESIKTYYSQMMDIESLADDLSRELNDYIDSIEFDEEKTAMISERLDLINHLKSKYGNSIEQIGSHKLEDEDKLNNLINYEIRLNELKADILSSENILNGIAQDITNLRKKAAKSLEKRAVEVLKDLNFLDVKFSIMFTKLEKYTETGMDEAEFMISTNPGEALKPLSQVASGGELSRIMLALKTILADRDSIETLIFDEIDAGISGRTAQMVSEKLNIIGRSCQVICITHLPQIAAMADSHYLIEKKTDNNKTTTQIVELDTTQMVNELARLLGGVKITETVIQNAAEMKALADKIKNSSEI